MTASLRDAVVLAGPLETEMVRETLLEAGWKAHAAEDFASVLYAALAGCLSRAEDDLDPMLLAAVTVAVQAAPEAVEGVVGELRGMDGLPSALGAELAAALRQVTTEALAAKEAVEGQDTVPDGWT